ncbi:energy transducer TonB [Olleya sp. Hel_I_94]|uniref:energy transducer TonB family protein n=1 Tax=Olleya sp. Hel_I_94 TaxID=1250001 RepID=UPI0011A3ED6B|nr:energy transducer TonB [Olleya sp. Hel_I_94]TVZ47831.1 TonB family protein [Olleya sp. Hel_I_94]|tara:strand:- start:14716 stop:15438 length:723 start_codon:yes stop_codon:yes gene_type:complete
MLLKNSHKALAITLLITGTLLLSVLNVTVFKTNTAVAETLYDIEQVEDIIENIAEQTPIKSANKATNKAFNTSENYKHYAQAYKPIAPPEDYINPKLETYKNDIKTEETTEASHGNSAISEKTLTSFNSVNEILSKRSKNSSTKQSNVANTNSSIYYSLKGRTDQYLPIPVYLCDAEGKIVVNITVNSNGTVIDAYINNASTSNNACLQEHALQYAKDAKFSTSTKSKQLGSITFQFNGK